MNGKKYPTRSGDWHRVDGVLVDKSAQPAAEPVAETAPAPVVDEAPTGPRKKRRLFGESSE